MRGNTTATEGSDTSTGNEVLSKRRAPARTSRRIATKETTEDGQGHKGPAKQEKKHEKKTARPKPDPNRETVVTENGYALHPNGLPTGRAVLMSRLHLFDFRTPRRAVLYSKSHGVFVRRPIRGFSPRKR